MNRRFFLDQALPTLEDCGVSTLEQSMEVLVADARDGLTPAEMVERKLVHLLRDSLGTGSNRAVVDVGTTKELSRNNFGERGRNSWTHP